MSVTVLSAFTVRIGPLNKGHLGSLAAQVALRVAPGVGVPKLTSSFGLPTLGVSSLLYTYSTFTIAAGASHDRLGAEYVSPRYFCLG
jgi:hypothetical protein